MPNADLERIMGGCEPGSLRSSSPRDRAIGKTVSASRRRRWPSSRLRQRVFSGEMPEQLAMRALSAYSNVPLAEIRERRARNPALTKRRYVQAGRA